MDDGIDARRRVDKLYSYFDLKGWIQDRHKVDIDVFVKINIPETERRRVLKELSLMNINPETMFPDLQGSALNCNFKLFLFAEKVNII